MSLGGEMMGNFKTSISYYQGAYSPTIRIDVRTKKWLEYFRKCIVNIYEEVEEEINIERLDDAGLGCFMCQ